MKTEYKLILFVTLAFSFLGARLGAESSGKVFRPERLKAFWASPISSSIAVDASAIEIYWCQDEGDPLSCNVLVDRVPLAHLRVRGGFEAQTERDQINLYYHGSRAIEDNAANDPDDRVLVATQDLAFGWFPKTELCKHPRRKLNCRYDLEPRTDAEGIQLNVYFSK